MAQVRDLPLEHHQYRRDHQEAEHHGDPVFGAPASRRSRRRTADGFGGGWMERVGHSALLPVAGSVERRYRIIFCFEAIENAKKENHFYQARNPKHEFYFGQICGRRKMSRGTASAI